MTMPCVHAAQSLCPSSIHFFVQHSTVRCSQGTTCWVLQRGHMTMRAPELASPRGAGQYASVHLGHLAIPACGGAW